MLNVAMLSKWHVHAEGYANELKNTGKVNITAVWDDNTARGSEWAARLGCDFEPDLAKLLARSDVDAVVCDAPTTQHKDVIIAAARAGKHIFTEKALAPTLAECEEIKAEILKSGVTFVISLPQRGTGAVQFARKMMAEGAFGRVNLVRIRNGHNGVSGNWLPDYWFEAKDAAGGALMDLGCHPMYTLAYLCGKPKRISAILNSPFGKPVDENAVATIEFENGIIGIAETSFIVYNTPSMVEVYGTEGSLVCQNDDIKFISSKLQQYVRGYVKPALPQGRPAPIVQFVDACINGTGSPEGLGIDDALALTELLEFSYVANNNNKIVER